MVDRNPQVKGFFDPATHTVSYVVWDRESAACAVIDPVLDYDADSGQTSTTNVDGLIQWVGQRKLEVHFILDTHIHADHLSAMQQVRARLGGALCIGRRVTEAQARFGRLFDAQEPFAIDGSQFDRLLEDGDELSFGNLRLRAWHTPGHTPGCMSYLVGDAVFVGDTLFMPDYGTARCDFPGGDARQLYRSIQRLYALPSATRMFLCHDYLAKGRDQHCWETSVADQKSANVHVHEGVTEDQFVAFRQRRDAKLKLPHLMLPAVQINIRAGALPPKAANGIAYLKIPLNTFAGPRKPEIKS